MSTLPALLITTAASGGLYAGRLYLRGTPKPGLSTVHGFLGFAGLSALVVFLQGGPGDASRTQMLGTIALALFTWSLFSGLVGPLYRESSKPTREAFLISHAAAGLIGLVVLLVWTVRRG
jgi:hypothetical protein